MTDQNTDQNNLDQDKIQAIANSIVCSLKPEVKLSPQHMSLIEALAKLWLIDPSLARIIERSFVAICNQEIN